MELSNHAIKRMKQRGFLKDHIELILEHGKAKRKPGDVLEIKLHKKDINQVIQCLKKTIQMLSKCKNKAILIDGSSETIITTYNLSK